MYAFDTPTKTTGFAHEIAAKGFKAALVYGRDDRCDAEMIAGLHEVGIGVGVVFEMGNPTTPDYFTLDQANTDANKYLTWLEKVKWPTELVTFVAADLDVNESNDSNIISYFESMHGFLKTQKYLQGAYGCGYLIEKLYKGGWIHSTWLAQSTGWNGYTEAKPEAGIVQGPGVEMLQFSVDLDYIQNDTNLLWLPS